MNDLRACVRCGLFVSAGACDVPPLMFHDRPEECILAIKRELSEARQCAVNWEQRFCTSQDALGHAERELVVERQRTADALFQAGAVSKSFTSQIAGLERELADARLVLERQTAETERINELRALSEARLDRELADEKAGRIVLDSRINADGKESFEDALFTSGLTARQIRDIVSATIAELRKNLTRSEALANQNAAIAAEALRRVALSEARCKELESLLSRVANAPGNTEQSVEGIDLAWDALMGDIRSALSTDGDDWKPSGWHVDPNREYPGAKLAESLNAETGAMLDEAGMRLLSNDGKVRR